jgi:Lipocalin-like domain
MKAFVGQPARILSVATLLAGLILFLVSEGWAQQTAGGAKPQIVGVWNVISSINTAKDGKVTNGISFGPNPDGRFIFTSSGHYASINVNPNLPKFASGSRLQGTPEENKAVVQGSLASFGTYSVSADGKVLMLKQDGGTWAARNGVEEKRPLTLLGDDMKFTTAATTGGTSELVYKRLK